MQETNEMNILFIGDIVSALGRQAITEFVPKIVEEQNIDIVIANGENTTAGRGISIKHYEELKKAGINAFTAGEHIYQCAEIEDYINNLDIAIPLNLYEELPGNRHITVDLGDGKKLTIISLLGTTFMREEVVNPFHSIEAYLEKKQFDHPVLVDFHAEATSEKKAMGYFLQGKVAAVCGTHTHVQTSDETILGNKTAYITDVGMTGSTNSVIGVKKEIVLNRFNKGIKDRFEWEKNGTYAISAVVISIDTDKQIPKNINRIYLTSR